MIPREITDMQDIKLRLSGKSDRREIFLYRNISAPVIPLNRRTYLLLNEKRENLGNLTEKEREREKEREMNK